MSTNPFLKPANPYMSFSVAASAGSGKTYQLSRRYLALVASGAKPSSILTVTFTQKAAAEMRSRILEDAAKLLQDKGERERFATEIRDFYTAAREAYLRHHIKLPPPRTPEETANAILSSTQTLQISTIDSLMLGWIKKFPWEASRPPVDTTHPLSRWATRVPSPLRTLDAVEDQEISQTLWKTLWQETLEGRVSDFSLSEAFQRATTASVQNLATKVEELNHRETYLWFHGLRRGEIPILPLDCPMPEGAPTTEDELLALICPLLRDMLDVLTDNAQARLGPALDAASLEALLGCGPITRGGTLHKSQMKRALDRFPEETRRVEREITSFLDRQRLSALNAQGKDLACLFHRFADLHREAKHAKGVVDFADYTKGTWQLFSSPESSGARRLIHRRVAHLMLDEFQDTSRLQWAIFSELAHELLSGESSTALEGGLRPTVFLVGDEKQSIYGFREADPTILPEATQALARFGLEARTLSESYRSSRVIMDFVNAVFQPRDTTPAPVEDLGPCPEHRAARVDDNTWVNPPWGSITVAEAMDADGGDNLPLFSGEATSVAQWLHEKLHGERPLLIHDKKLGRVRPLRPGDCAILFRNSTHASTFEEALRARQIPCLRESSKGFFARREIQDIVALLRWLAFPEDILSLATVLRSPWIDLADKNLLELLREASAQPSAHYARHLITSLERDHATLVSPLLALARDAALMPTAELLVEALTHLKILERARQAFGEAEGLLAEANLIRFVETVTDLSRGEALSLPMLVRRLEQMAESDQEGNAAVSANAVSLMTIHGAKGLEWPLVALVQTGQSWEKSDRWWVRAGAGQPAGVRYVGAASEHPTEDASFQALLEADKKERREESARLLYVALTRARQHLWISGSAKAQASGGLNLTGYLPQLREAVSRLNPSVVEHPVKALTYEVSPPASSEPPCDASPTPVTPSVSLPAPPVNPARASFPQEIALTTPHRLAERAAFARARGTSPPSVRAHEHLSPWPRLTGLFIHAGLEAFIKETPFAPDMVWEELLHREAPELHASPEYHAERHTAATLLGSLLDSDLWKNLLSDCLSRDAELAFVHRTSEGLVHGVMDLLLDKGEKGLFVVDYKTNAPSADLRAWCETHGYDAQIRAYVEAVRVMHPNRPVTGLILAINQQPTLLAL